jgi:hypothetical protein
MDPLITVTVPAEVSKSYKKVFSHSKFGKRFANVPPKLQSAITGSAFDLDPDVTLYVPRRGLSGDDVGQSMYNRVILIHLLEKAILKGTIDLAHRRQKAILHITAGDSDWEPTAAQLMEITQSFLSADADPVSAVVATRNGVQTNEIRAGADFWSWDQISESTSNQKMRALGINDAFLSGDASWPLMFDRQCDEVRAMQLQGEP